MADFSHEPSRPLTALPRNQPIRSEQDLTHRRHGPLGDMSVVPDDYVGPMPHDAVRASDYHRMTKVYGEGAPVRDSYSGASWDGPDIWGQQKDAEEPPRKSPRR